MNNYEWLQRAGEPATIRVTEELYDSYQKLYLRIGYKEFIYALNDYIEEVIGEPERHECERKRRISVWLKPDLKKAIVERCARTGEAKAAIIRDALERAVDEYGLL